MADASGFAEVALPLPIDQVFTYRVPDALCDAARPGCRAFVSFGSRLLTGVITGRVEQCPVADPKPILDVLDLDPIMDGALLDLTRWVADYYLCPWGEAIRAALPAGLLNEAEQTVSLTKPCPPDVIERLRRTAPRQALLLASIAEHQTVSVIELKRRLKIPQLFGLLRNLEARGFIEFIVGNPAADPGIRYETWVELTLSAEETEETVARLAVRAPRQASCLNLLLKHDRRLTTDQLRHLGGVEASVLKTLVQRGMVETYEVEVIRDPYRDYRLSPAEPMRPTLEQALALGTIQEAIQQNDFAPILLYGVTGSGKTFVYTEAIRKTLFTGRAAIVLVPELALTPQTVQQFRAHFGDLVAVLHSGLSTGERFDSWRQIKAGKYRIVVGARSAVFAPVPHLGLIVVDEEHEPSYKQLDDPPLYHARDVAVMRARLVRGVTLLGSATPSLETFSNTQNDKFRLCRLTERVDRRPLPVVHIVDMRDEHREGNWSLFSRILTERIADRLEKNEQIILFLNRRGFSTFIQCHDCGFTFSCSDCSVTYTYHADSLLLRCHYCDRRMEPPDECPKCRSRSVRFRGTGTQRVEEEIKKRFPGARIARMDMDTTTRKGAHQDIFRRVATRQADILLGTQMVAKGFDFPHVTLVGVISADTTLNLPDFRASERTFQLLTQVAGRTGRSSLGGEVIVQTYSLGHHSIVSAQTHDYETFYVQEIAERRELSYPPFGRMVSILFQGKEEKTVIQEAKRFRELLRKSGGGLTVSGPASSVIERVRGEYRWHLMARSPHSKTLRETVKTVWKKWEQNADKKIRIKIDIDPIGMM
ncbi:MAG: primosomal protein N' [candidate division Zixibacteria bacterium]|nr:primosomal protein N' [candidate division Zixibacteria bacterium]